MAVEVKPGSTFEALATKPLFDVKDVNARGLVLRGGAFLGFARDNYAVSGDGQRFLINNTTETSTPLITVVLNWTADLKRN